MTAFHSTQRPSRFTNPFSALHSNESCLAGVEFDVCSQRDVPLSVFNFVTFFNLQKSRLLTSIRPELASHSPCIVQKSHHSSNTIPCCLWWARMVNFDPLWGLQWSFWGQCCPSTAIHSQVSHFNLVSRKDHAHSPSVFWGQQQHASFNCEFVYESIEERSYAWEEELWMP